MQQRQITILLLIITAVCATEINFFDAQSPIPVGADSITIYSNLIQLWTNVTDCPSSPCECNVDANATNENPTDRFNVSFLPTLSNLGFADVLNLKPNTLYSFTITCVGTVETITRYIRTDYGAPSPPQNMTVTLVSRRLRISWLPPLSFNGPLNNYRLRDANGMIEDNIPTNQFSYDMDKDVVQGQEYTFFLVACNINRLNDSVCSNPNEAQASFLLPTVPTISTTTQLGNAAEILSYSKLITILGFVLLVIKINHM